MGKEKIKEQTKGCTPTQSRVSIQSIPGTGRGFKMHTFSPEGLDTHEDPVGEEDTLESNC